MATGEGDAVNTTTTILVSNAIVCIEAIIDHSSFISFHREGT